MKKRLDRENDVMLTRDNCPVMCKKHPDSPMWIKPNRFTYCKKCVRNRIARDRNAILAEVCGTSARAAREDMGLCR